MELANSRETHCGQLSVCLLCVYYVCIIVCIIFYLFRKNFKALTVEKLLPTAVAKFGIFLKMFAAMKAGRPHFEAGERQTTQLPSPET